MENIDNTFISASEKLQRLPHLGSQATKCESLIRNSRFDLCIKNRSAMRRVRMLMAFKDFYERAGILLIRDVESNQGIFRTDYNSDQNNLPQLFTDLNN